MTTSHPNATHSPDELVQITVHPVSLFMQHALFMQATEQTVGDFNPAQFILYLKLIREESNELREALERGDWLGVFDALLDLHAVVAGAGLSIGFPMSDGWNEVVRSNLSKRDPETGKVLKRDDGKILKPDSYSPPNLAGVLNANGWKTPDGTDKAALFREALAALTGEEQD